ncbi:hypothetical protein D9M73_103030 [compost metagenome]
MDIAERAARHPLNQSAAIIDPLAVSEPGRAARRNRAHHHLATTIGTLDTQPHAAADGVFQQRIEIVARADRDTADADDAVARHDLLDRGGAERHHFAHDETAPGFIGGAIKPQAEIADTARWQRPRPHKGPVDAGVRGVEFADHQADDPAQFIGRARACDIRLEVRPQRRPVMAVKPGIEEFAVEDAPCLIKHNLLFACEVDVHIGDDGDRLGLGRLDRRRNHAPTVEIEQRLAVPR